MDPPVDCGREGGRELGTVWRPESSKAAGGPMVNSSRADDDRGGGRVWQAAALSLRDSPGIMAWDLVFAV